MELLYEGKSKRMFEIEDPFVLKVEYKDEVTAADGRKREKAPGKGRLSNIITSEMFEKLEAVGIPSHFIERTGDTTQLVRKVEIIPLEVVVRNLAAGNITKRLGFEKGAEFAPPLLEIYLKDDALGDPLINRAHAIQMDIATDKEISELKKRAHQLNVVLIGIMEEMGLQLVDFKVEFGRDTRGNILLADEISPDTCRIWDPETGENFDKDVFREGTGSVVDTYRKFYEKMEALK